MTSTTKRAKCLSGSHSFTDGGRRYAVSRSIVRKLLKSAHPETKKGRINVSILPDAAQCAKSDRLLERLLARRDGRGQNVVQIIRPVAVLVRQKVLGDLAQPPGQRLGNGRDVRARA